MAGPFGTGARVEGLDVRQVGAAQPAVIQPVAAPQVAGSRALSGITGRAAR